MDSTAVPGRGENFPSEVDTSLNINRLWAGAWPGPPERRVRQAGPAADTPHPGSCWLRSRSAAPPRLPPPRVARSRGGLRVPSSGCGERRVPPGPVAAGAVTPAAGTGRRGTRVPAKNKGRFGSTGCSGMLTFGKGD